MIEVGLCLVIGLGHEEVVECDRADRATDLGRFGVQTGPYLLELRDVADDEIAITHLGGELETPSRLTRADNGDAPRRQRLALTLIELEPVALEIRDACLPELLEYGHVLGRVVVAALVVLVARPQSHLLILVLVPAGNDVEPEATL